MLRRFLRILLPGGLLLGLAMLLRRTVSLRHEAGEVAAPAESWLPIPTAPVATWVAADADGTCPPSHPIKAKSTSGLFHLPGMFAYARTKPDRCYADEAAAVADGFAKAKR
jgi:hypothetical protein